MCVIQRVTVSSVPHAPIMFLVIFLETGYSCFASVYQCGWFLKLSASFFRNSWNRGRRRKKFGMVRHRQFCSVCCFTQKSDCVWIAFSRIFYRKITVAIWYMWGKKIIEKYDHRKRRNFPTENDCPKGAKSNPLSSF